MTLFIHAILIWSAAIRMNLTRERVVKETRFTSTRTASAASTKVEFTEEFCVDEILRVPARRIKLGWPKVENSYDQKNLTLTALEKGCRKFSFLTLIFSYNNFSERLIPS